MSEFYSEFLFRYQMDGGDSFESSYGNRCS